jgi:hypothetical protein
MSSQRHIEINDEVRAEVSSPELDPKEMEYCVLSPQIDLRCIVATNPNLPNQFANWMARDIEPTVRAAVSQNQHIDPAIILQLSHDSNLAVVSAAATNPVLDNDRLSELANHRSYIVRNEVARNASAPISVLEKLAKDSEWGVRRSVATNFSASTDLLHKLSLEEVDDIQLAVAANLQTSLETLRALWKSAKSTRSTVVSNPGCSEDFLFQILEDALKPTEHEDENTDDDIRGETNIREAVARRPDLTRGLIAKLLSDPSYYVRKELAESSLLTEQDLSVLALDPSENVRQAVVENPNTSRESKAAATLLGLPDKESSDE